MKTLRLLPLATNPRPDAETGDAGHVPCGWFDSSQDLLEGLRVVVHDEPDALAALVPLAWWLQWELEACAPPATPSVAPPGSSSAPLHGRSRGAGPTAPAHLQ